MSYSSSSGASSSYSSSPSDTEASWYCWYSETRSFHVALSLGEFHLVHALAGVPMQEGLATEHSGELVADTLEELLDGGAVADEGELIFRPRGGMEQRAVWTLLGIHSTK